MLKLYSRSLLVTLLGLAIIPGGYVVAQQRQQPRPAEANIPNLPPQTIPDPSRNVNYVYPDNSND